jgi:photosystem II stability/assembly factor-like uncharacterized protein
MNGGVNWIVQDYEFPAVFRKVHFFDENTGFIVGEKNIGIGYVLKTTNSGVNWNEVYVSSINQTGLEDQHWFNALTGWVCGYNTLMKTTNGGLNLTSFYTSIPPTQNGSNWLFGISFTNDSIGWLAAANVDRKNIYKTTNSGLNWFFQDNPVAQYEFSGASHVLFMSPDTGWAAVYYLGVILATTNGGNNWVIDEMANSEFYRFSIYNNSKIWCAGYPGQIWYATIHEPNGGLGQGEKLPAQFKLLQNYPNPFNSETTIKYDLPKDGFVMFKVYDVLGKELYSSTVYRTAGTHQITLDGSNYASGLYFYRIETGSYIETKKMVLVK